MDTYLSRPEAKEMVATMASRSVLIVVLLFSLSWASAQAPSVAEQFTAQELYQQIGVLETAGILQLSAEQIAGYLSLLRQVNENHEQVLASADQAWEQYSTIIEQAIAAGIAGQPAPIEVSQSVLLATTNFAQQRDAFYRYLQSSASQFMAYLTSEQRQLIEDAATPQRRAEMARQLEGAASVAEYIVRVLDAQRELMPDEYELVRIPQAEQTAAKIVGPRSREFANLADRVLGLTDTVFGWSQEQYVQQYPGLEQQVSEYLQLPPAPAAAPLTYQKLLDLLSSPFTVPLLQRVAALPTTDPLPSGTRVVDELPLPQAIAGLRLLELLNRLQVTPRQLAALVPVVQQIKVLAEPLRHPLGSQGEGLIADMVQARDLLLATGQLSPEWAQFEAAVEEGQQEARLRIAVQLEQVAGIMSPAQNDLIDWRPPADVLAADIDRLGRAQRRLLAEMRHTVSVLERLRFRQMQLYQRTRIVELNQLLERYGISEHSPRYREYRSFGIDILNRMRMTQREDWQRQKVLLALEFLRGVGAVEELAGRPTTAKPVTWEDMYAAFTDPQAGQIVQQMLAARSSR